MPLHPHFLPLIWYSPLWIKPGLKGQFVLCGQTSPMLMPSYNTCSDHWSLLSCSLTLAMPSRAPSSLPSTHLLALRDKNTADSAQRCFTNWIPPREIYLQCLTWEEPRGYMYGAVYIMCVYINTHIWKSHIMYSMYTTYTSTVSSTSTLAYAMAFKNLLWEFIRVHPGISIAQVN